MQSGKHLRSCLVQLRAHTGASPEVRPSCSGLQLVTFCKLPRMKPAQPLWAECHCQTALRQSEEIVPPYIQSELLPFHFMFIVTDLPALRCCEESGSISLKTFPKMLWAAPRTPQIISSPGWTSPALPASPHQRRSRSSSRSSSILIIDHEIGSIYWSFS